MLRKKKKNRKKTQEERQEEKTRVFFSKGFAFPSKRN